MTYKAKTFDGKEVIGELYFDGLKAMIKTGGTVTQVMADTLEILRIGED